MTIDEIIHLAEQMVLLLATLHSQNIVHRDIKPENFVKGIKS